ncbi:MAG: hypothetical protein NT099_00435 [Candidatus Saganbacteria bacterium]|nr:hypothetical protein [Candidatus Saganbacteria bacterium]
MIFGWADNAKILESSETIQAAIERAKKNGNSTEAKLRILELKILQEMLNCPLASTGGGSKSIDFKRMGALKSSLGEIYNIFNSLAHTSKIQTQMRSLVHQEMTGIGSMESSPLTISALEADLSKIQELFAMRVTLKSMELEGENREISIGLLAAKLVLWAIQLIFKVPTDVIPASFIAAAMNFNNSIWDLAYADKDAKEGYGNLKEVKVSDIVSKVREYEEKDDEERKDINPEARAEVALYKKLDTGLIEDGSDGNQMLNAGYKIYYQELMEGIYRVKDLIAKLQAAKAEHRSIVHSALTGIGSATPLGEEANQVDQRIALELVELLFARIESIVERQNQINAAKMQLVMEAVGFSLGLVSFIISSITLGAGISDTYAKDNIASNNNKMYSADKLVPLPEAETDALQTEIDDLIKLQESLGKTTKITSIISPIVSFLKVIAPIVTEASYKSHKNSESSGKKAVNEKDIKHSSTGNQMADKLNASQDQSIRHSIQSGRNPVQAMDKTWEKWINIILFQAITSLANMIHLSIVLPLIEPEVTRAEMTNSQSQVKDALQRIHTVTDKFKEGQALTPQWARYVQHQIAQASKYVATLQKSGDPQVKAQGATIEEALKDYGQIVAIIHDNVGEISGAKVEFLKGALEEVDAKLDGLPILKDSKELQLATLASKATLEDVAKGAAQSKELEEKLLQLQKLMADGKTEEAAALCKEITPLLQENSAFLAALISNKDVPEAEKKEAQAFKDQLDALTTQFNEADPKSMDTALIKDLAGQIHMEAGVLISTLQAKAILVVPDRSPEAVKTEMQKALQIAGNGEFTVKVGQLSPEVAHLLHQQGSYKAWVLEDGTFSTHSPMIAGPEEVLANPSFRAELSTKDIFINADSIKAAASLGDQINSQIPINPDEIIRASVAAQDVKCQIDPVSSQAVPDLDINAVVKMINQFVQSKATPASTVEATEAQQLNAIKEAIVTAIVSNVKKEMAEIAPLFATEKPQPNQPLAPNPALKTVSPETKATQVVSAKDATVKSTNPNIKAEVVVYPNILSEVNNISRSSSSTVASQIQINAQQSSTTTTVKSAEQTQVLRQITEEVSTERVVKQAFVPQFETPTQTKTIPQSSNFIQAVAAAAEIINPETVVEAAFVFPNKENERTVQTQKAVQSAANIQAREADPLTAPVIGNRKSTIRTQTVINPAAAETVNKIVSQTQDKPVQFIAEQKQQSNASQAHLARADAIEQAILGTQGNQKVNTAPVSKEGIPINKLSEKELVETLMSLRDQRDQILKSQKQTEQIKIVKEEIESLQKTLQQLTDGSIKVPEFVASKEEYEKILKQEVQSKTAELEDLEKADKGDTKSKFAAAKKISEKTKAIVSALQDKVKARLVQEGRIKPNMKEAEIRRIVEHETDRLIQKSEKESVKATAEKSVTKESAKTQGSKETPATTIVAAKEKVENKANTNPIAEVEEAKAAETDSPKDTVKISKNHSEIKSSPAQTQLHVAVKQKEVLVQKAENLKIQLETVKKQTATTIAKAEIAEDQLKPEVEKLKQEIQKLDLNIQSYQDLRTEHKPESPEFGLISRMIEDAQTQKASLTDKISQLTGEVETLKTEVRAQKETTQKIETEIIKVTAQATEANTQIATVKATLAAVQGINTASVKEATEDKTLAKEKVNTKNDKGSAKKADNSKEASPSTINMINKVSHEKPSREKPFQKLAENQTIQEPVTTDVKQEKAPQTVTMAGQTIQQPSQQSIPKAALNTAPPTEINPKNPIVTNTQQVNAQKTAINTTTPTEISPKNLTVITNTTTAITQVSVPIETAKEPEIVSAIVKEQAKTEQVQSRVNQDKVIEQVKGEIIELEKNVIAVKAQVMAPPAELSKEEYQAVLQTQIEQKEKEVEMLKAVNSGNQAAKTEVLKQSTAKTEVMISVLETKVQIRLEKEMKITGKTLPEKAKEMVEKETTSLIKEETKALQAGPLSQKEVPVSIPQNLDQILKEHTSEKPIHTIPNINIPIFKDMPLEKFIPEARQAAKGQSLLLAYIDQIEKAMQTAQTTPTTATNAPGQTTAPQNTATPAPVTEAMQADPKMLLEQLKSELVKLQIEKNTIIKEIEVLKVELKTLSKELAAKLPALEAQERAVENQMNKVGQKIIDIDKNVAKLRDLLSNQKPGTKEYELIAKMIRDYEGEKEALFGKMKDLNAELSMLKGEADQVVKEMRKIKVQIREAFQKLAQTDTKIMEVQNAIAQTVKALEEGEKELKKNRKNNEKEEDAVTAAKEKERNSGVSSAIRSLLGNGNGKNKDQKQKQTVLFKKEEEEKEPVHASGSFIGTKENDLYSQAASAARAQKTLNGKHNGTSVA